MDAGEEAIEDDLERRAVRAQARAVRWRAVILALVLTAAAWAIPA
jgi:hypothetical protein